MSEEAFDLIEPHVRTACPQWTPGHRYGVFDLPVSVRTTLSTALTADSSRIPTCDERNGLFQSLANWLETCSPHSSVNILGI